MEQGAVLGREWATRGFRQTGWVLLPLRGFLGVTFLVAALQKLANPAFFDPHSPTSIQAQMRAFQHTSPIGGLVGLAAHHAGVVGLLIAIGELGVGLGTLCGLWTRVAAAAGALLSLTFFLTVSWNTSPYYYGADIVFLFAWTPLLLVGAAGVLSLDGLIATGARRDLGLRPEPNMLALPVPRVRELCPRRDGCGLGRDGRCGRLSRCPVLATTGPPLAETERLELSRRQFLRGGRAAAVVAGGGLLLGGLTAAAGRAFGSGGTAAPGAGGGLSPRPGPVRSPGSASPPGPTASPAAGTVIGRSDQVPVGQAGSFTDPASGQPAWLVHLASAKFVAFSAVCTHAGCTVQFDPSTVEFQCPCHGGVYDARTGQVLAGPPPTPLPSIPVSVRGGVVRVDG